MLIAIFHLAAATIVSGAIGIFVFLLSVYEATRNQKRQFAELSLTHGVALPDLDSGRLPSEFVRLLSMRYGSDLLQNRISNFAGTIRTLWGWIGFAINSVISVAVLWFTFAKDYGIAPLMWSIVGIQLFFFLASVAFSLVCKLATGRYPGEAKQSRDALVG